VWLELTLKQINQWHHNKVKIQYSPSENPLQIWLTIWYKDDSTIHPRTIPIVGIQSGVTDGKRDNQLFMFIIIYQVTLILMLKR
jgi:hypothetical protein